MSYQWVIKLQNSRLRCVFWPGFWCFLKNGFAQETCQVFLGICPGIRTLWTLVIPLKATLFALISQKVSISDVIQVKSWLWIALREGYLNPVENQYFVHP